jgi:hypothetical protein
MFYGPLFCTWILSVGRSKILVNCKGGAKIKDRFNWLESVLQQKIAELGAIWIYVWFGTCDLTSYNKKFISISFFCTWILSVGRSKILVNDYLLYHLVPSFLYSI